MPSPWDVCACIFVEYHMDDFADRDLRLDCIQKADELPMTVTLHAVADNVGLGAH